MPSDLAIALHALPRVADAVRTPGYRDGDLDVTAHQLRLLSALDDSDPTMVGELAEFMGVTASTMSLNLKRLESAGLVTRDRDPADRRVMNVRLTARGRSTRDAYAPVDPERMDSLLAMLRPDVRHRAVAGLAALADAADRLMARGGEHVAALTSSGRPDASPSDAPAVDGEAP